MCGGGDGGGGGGDGGGGDGDVYGTRRIYLLIVYIIINSNFF